MEDAHLVELSLPNGEALFGVFDGHGGKEVAEFCSQEFASTLQSLDLYVSQNYEEALKECFIKIDAQLMSESGMDKIVQISKEVQEEQRITDQTDFVGGNASDDVRKKIPVNTGSTACVLLVTQTEIYCANVGDSRAILSRGDSVFELSIDHKPDDEEEKRRIKAAGKRITSDGRIENKLALSRAIGDHYFKQNNALSVEEQAITCVPDVTCIERHPDDSFLLVACDGIWDVLTSQECVE